MRWIVTDLVPPPGCGKLAMRPHRLQSPFRYWRSGLIVEILAIGLFIATVFLTMAVLVRVL
ncbi:MAG: hypothetical protein P1P71_02060 [Anaerosomatales bacterium]|nr:hypothetical protein [Anaerosomatales bacterium]